MLKVVVDTNVVISALLAPYGNPALIISLILQKELALCLSSEIFAEYQEVLSRNKFKKLNKAAVKRLLKDLKKHSIQVLPKVSVRLIQNDPADNKFLECALASNADFIITGNIKHFSFKKFHRASIATPSEFLSIAADMLLNV